MQPRWKSGGHLKATRSPARTAWAMLKYGARGLARPAAVNSLCSGTSPSRRRTSDSHLLTSTRKPTALLGACIQYAAT